MMHLKRISPQQIANTGLVLIVLGIVLDRTARHLPSKSVLLAVGSLVALLAGMALLIAGFVRKQPLAARRKALIIGVVSSIIGLIALPVLIWITAR